MSADTRSPLRDDLAAEILALIVRDAPPIEERHEPEVEAALAWYDMRVNKPQQLRLSRKPPRSWQPSLNSPSRRILSSQ